MSKNSDPFFPHTDRPPRAARGARSAGGALFSVLAGLCLGLNSALCPAVGITIAIDTRGLAAQSAPPAPFSLDFQFVDGGGTATNTAVLSHFDFGGGSTTSSDCTSATCVDGGSVTGPPLVIMLTDDPSFGGGFLNEVVLPFTPGSSGPLSFQLDLTTNLERGVGVSPDAFTIAILDSSGFGIPTDFFDVFVQIDITAPLTIATYASDMSQSQGINIPAPSVRSAEAPEPGTLLLFASALGGIVLAGSWPSPYRSPAASPRRSRRRWALGWH